MAATSGVGDQGESCQPTARGPLMQWWGEVVLEVEVGGPQGGESFFSLLALYLDLLTSCSQRRKGTD